MKNKLMLIVTIMMTSAGLNLTAMKSPFELAKPPTLRLESAQARSRFAQIRTREKERTLPQAGSTAMAPQSLADLPPDVLKQIMAELSDQELSRLARTSSWFRGLAQEQIEQRRIVRLEQQRREFQATISADYYLTLSGRDLKYIMPGVFQGIGKFGVLYLDNNCIEILSPKTFKGTPKTLAELILSNNYIQILQPKTFQGLKKLINLFLNNNRIRILQSGAFQGLEELSRLDLDNNKLQELFPGIFHCLPNLQWLDLSNNQLNNLPPKIFKDIPSLQYLFLRGNPLSHENVQQLRDALPGVKIYFE